MTDDRDEERLRRGLQGLAADGSASPLDTRTLREDVRRRAHRVQAGRRIAGGLGVVVALAAAGLWFLAEQPQVAESPINPANSSSSTPAGTVTSSATPSATASPSPSAVVPTPVNTRPSTLRVSLRVTSGQPSPEGGSFVAKWEVTWSGGSAPVYQVLIEEPGPVVRTSTEIGARCDGPVGPGSAHGELLFDSPGPHEIIAVVRAKDCANRVDRQTDTDIWTWSQPTQSP
jgi:hypothetical protein